MIGVNVLVPCCILGLGTDVRLLSDVLLADFPGKEAFSVLE